MLKQLYFFQDKPLGFKTDYVLSVPINGNLLFGYNSYKNELLRNPGVLNVTAGQGAPFNEDYKSGAEWDGKDPQMVPVIRYSIKTVGLWSARARQRRELAALPYEFLDDIGITREEALREARKPFWQA